MAGTRRSARVASSQGSQGSQVSSPPSQKSPNTANKKRKAEIGNSPSAKRGKQAPKEQKTIEESMDLDGYVRLSIVPSDADYLVIHPNLQSLKKSQRRLMNQRIHHWPMKKKRRATQTQSQRRSQRAMGKRRQMNLAPMTNRKPKRKPNPGRMRTIMIKMVFPRKKRIPRRASKQNLPLTGMTP